MIWFILSAQHSILQDLFTVRFNRKTSKNPRCSQIKPETFLFRMKLYDFPQYDKKVISHDTLCAIKRIMLCQHRTCNAMTKGQTWRI